MKRNDRKKCPGRIIYMLPVLLAAVFMDGSVISEVYASDGDYDYMEAYYDEAEAPAAEDPAVTEEPAVETPQEQPAAPEPVSTTTQRPHIKDNTPKTSENLISPNYIFCAALFAMGMSLIIISNINDKDSKSIG